MMDHIPSWFTPAMLLFAGAMQIFNSFLLDRRWLRGGGVATVAFALFLVWANATNSTISEVLMIAALVAMLFCLVMAAVRREFTRRPA